MKSGMTREKQPRSGILLRDELSTLIPFSLPRYSFLHGIRSSVSLRVSNLKLQSVQPQCVGDHGDRAEGHGDAGDHRT